METMATTENNATANQLFARMTGRNDSDWQAYLQTCREISGNASLNAVEIRALKQASALAYLGKRAQNEGGVYSKTQARILTPEFVQLMTKLNTAQRFQRYPWLERLLGLLDEIDQVQDQISLKGNVLPFMAAKNPVQASLQSPLSGA